MKAQGPRCYQEALIKKKKKKKKKRKKKKDISFSVSAIYLPVLHYNVHVVHIFRSFVIGTEIFENLYEGH